MPRALKMGCKLRDNMVKLLKVKTQNKDIKNIIQLIKTQEIKVKML